MADFRAISGVSASLRNLLVDRLEQTVSVTVAPPDVQVSGMTDSRVNVYLYHVKENGYLKNQEIPGQGHPGSFGHPPLSLDLRYLLTAFAGTETAPDADLEAQQILGDAMRVLHDFPVITDTLHQNDDPVQPRILDPSLIGEFEEIKITLEPNDLDEFSSVWSGLPEAAFRRSVSYQCSVVQIESQRVRRIARPVREHRVYALPFNAPHIDSVMRDPPFPGYPPGPAAGVGDAILIIGRNLRGDSTRVVIGGETVSIVNPQARRIELTVPNALMAGLHPVHVVHDLLLEAGGPPTVPPTLVPHRGFASNTVAFMVLPAITATAPAAPTAGTVVTVTVDPPVGADQSRTLLLDDHVVPGNPVAVDSPPSATVDFTLPTGSGAIPPGTYLTRVRVAGAESLLTVDPGTGAFSGPTITVT